MHSLSHFEFFISFCRFVQVSVVSTKTGYSAQLAKASVYALHQFPPILIHPILSAYALVTFFPLYLSCFSLNASFCIAVTEEEHSQ